MEFVYELIVILHFIGLASLLGGWLVEVRGSRTVNSAILHGALTQLVTGLALVGLAETLVEDEGPLNHAKIGVKLTIVLVITLVGWKTYKAPVVPTPAFMTIGALTLANVAIAVLW